LGGPVKIDVVQDAKDHTYTISVKIDQFKTLRDYEVIHNLINAISLDFDLDPEISVEDLKGIVAEAKKEEATEVTCDIGPEGIDIEF
jgi:FKBP-type peptidyl-prolyl cis-trans isomerase (trigger factor)